MHKYFLIFLFPATALLSLGLSTSAEAAALTEAQIQAIVSLLNSFGAEQTVVNNVNISLRGKTPLPSAPQIETVVPIQQTGSTTPSALLESAPSSPASVLSETLLPFERTLRVGSSGDDVEKLQTFLSQFLDIYPEKLVTSFFGPLTQRAIERFQVKYAIISSGSPETTGFGILGPKTRAKISELLTEGAGKSEVIPPGLLHASGLYEQGVTTIATSSTATPSGTTTPATIPATPAVPAIPATPAVPESGGGSTSAVPATPAVPAQPATATTTTTSDTTAPSIPTGLSAIAVSSSQINLAWTASTDNVGVTGYKIYRTGSLITSVTGTSYSNTGLIAGTSYSYTVATYDAAGNVSAQSNPVSATTAGTATTAPWTQAVVPSSLVIDKGSTLNSNPPSVAYSARFNYTPTSDTKYLRVYLKRPTSADFVFYAYDAQLSLLDPSQWNESTASPFLRRTGASSWYWWPADEFLPNAGTSRFGEYKIYVTALNTVGEESVPSETKSIKIYAPPTISSPVDGSTVSTKPTITFVTGDSSISSQYFASYVYKANGTVTWSGGPASTNFAYPGTELNPSDNPHRLAVHSYAGAPNFPYWYSPFSQVTFSVSVSPPAADTTAPSTPTGLSATAVSSTQINLSWSATTDNVGVTGYYIYRNGSQSPLASIVSGLTYNDTGLLSGNVSGLSPGTLYTYTVAAYDAAGNISAQSSSVNATTHVDFAVTSVSVLPSSVVAGDSVTVSATFYNPSNTTQSIQVTIGKGVSSTNDGTVMSTTYYLSLPPGNTTRTQTFTASYGAISSAPGSPANTYYPEASIAGVGNGPIYVNPYDPNTANNYLRATTAYTVTTLPSIVCGDGTCNGSENWRSNSCPADCPIPACIDSDGGRNYSVKGSIPDSPSPWTDYCKNTTTLRESYCNPNVANVTGVTLEDYVCSSGCQDGACLVATSTSAVPVQSNLASVLDSLKSALEQFLHMF